MSAWTLAVNDRSVNVMRRRRWPVRGRRPPRGRRLTYSLPSPRQTLQTKKHARNQCLVKDADLIKDVDLIKDADLIKEECPLGHWL